VSSRPHEGETESTDSEVLPQNQLPGADERATVQRVVVFRLGTQRYGIPLAHVDEIQQIVAFSDVPADSTSVVGMVNLRGEVIPAIDVRRLVGMEDRAYTLETPMIIAHSDAHTVALIVDVAEDVVELPDSGFQSASPLHALSSKMIGVYHLDGGLVYLLDLDELLEQVLLGEEAENV